MTGTDLKIKGRRDVDNVVDVFEKAQLDYSQMTIGCHDHVNFKIHLSNMPEEYLRFARQDFASGDSRGRVNALSNAKRCIEAVVDCVINSLGVNPIQNIEAVVDFCDDVLESESQSIKPLPLRLFAALGFAPSLIINEIRWLRQLVEQQYSIPEPADARRAIEVAELLLNNIKAKEFFSTSIDITDQRAQKGHSGHITGVFFSESSPVKGGDTSAFMLRSNQTAEGDRLQYRFNGSEPALLYLLRAMFMAYHNEIALRNTIIKLLKSLELETENREFSITSTHR